MSPPPSQRNGVVMSVALALAVGVALVIARLRHPVGPPSLPHAGEAPCLFDIDCGGRGWACGPAGRCVEANGDRPSISP